ncbi:MAG: hypothetical protein AB7J13_02200 [Pyrinomonadaceae bacterium]
MNIIKLILAIIGIFFAGMVVLWLFGFLTSILWYAFWIGLLGGIAYGGYKLFTKIESKALGGDKHDNLGTGDISMSWDEYDKKYLHK